MSLLDRISAPAPPPGDVVPHFVDHVALPPVEAHVATFIDGRRTVDEVVRDSRVERPRVETLIARLASAQLVRLD